MKLMIKEFLSHSSVYADMRERKEMLGKVAYVSRKLMEEGWKVGYMSRDKAIRENDSGMGSYNKSCGN